MEQLRFLAIPLGIIIFNALYMFIMRTILLSLSKTVAPFVALAIAACILGGAAYLSRRAPNPPTVESVEHPHH